MFPSRVRGQAHAVGSPTPRLELSRAPQYWPKLSARQHRLALVAWVIQHREGRTADIGCPVALHPAVVVAHIAGEIQGEVRILREGVRASEQLYMSLLQSIPVALVTTS